jgi:hypothetical protein
MLVLYTLTMKLNKITSIFFIFLFAVASIATPILATKTKKASAVPTVTITSPTEGQSISGTNFTATGTATPNTTVVLSSGGVSFAQTVSDGSGNWSIPTSLPAGNVSLTARAIQNPEFGYFSSTEDLSSFNINRIRITDSVVNPGGGSWPITGADLGAAIIVPSPVSSVFYGFAPFAPSLPTKLDTVAASISNVSGSYPAATSTSKGDFNASGTLYFSPNIEGNSLSVINTATNAWQQDITFPGSSSVVTATRTPDNLILVSTVDKYYEINPTTLTILNEYTAPCLSANVLYARESAYPYYFATCIAEGKIIKLSRANNTVVSEFNVGFTSSFGTLSQDNQKIYISGQIGTPGAENLYVVDTASGNILTTVPLGGAAVALYPTPDNQKIFAAVPNIGGLSLQQNIQVIDLKTNTISDTLALSNVPISVSYNAEEAEIASTQVNFVLGSTSSNTVQKLAETGAIGISSTLLIGIIIAVTSYLYLDYRAHKKPLKAEDPHVKYTFLHHIRVVSMPRLKYRVAVTVSVSKRSSK